MTTPDYDYHGMVASTWDLWRDNTSDWPDRHRYLAAIQQYGQPVLDVGCGTGRIILDFLQLGMDVDGMDDSPEMLAVCREKAEKLGLSANLYEQKMETLDLPRKYRTIIAPSSTFQLLTDADKARQALQRFFEHLEPGGAFISPFYFSWAEGEPLDYGWQPKFVKTRPEDGAIVRSWAHEWHEPEKQLWHAEERYEVELNGQIVAKEEMRRSPEGRWYTQEQAVKLYREVGFADIQLTREFEQTPAVPEDRNFCALGVKPKSY